MAPSNDTTVVLRIPQELKENLQEQAEQLDVSLSEVIRMKLMIAESVVHREPVIRLGEQTYRLWDVLRRDVLEYEIVESDAEPAPEASMLIDEPGSHESAMWSAHSDAVQKAIGASRTEAIRLGHGEITPAHLVLGMLKAGDCNARRIIAHLTGNVDRVIQTLEETAAVPGVRSVMLGRVSPKSADKNLALTKKAEKAMKLCYMEAKLHRRDVVDTGILLLATLRDDDAGLGRFGVSYDAVRALVE